MSSLRIPVALKVIAVRLVVVFMFAVLANVAAADGQALESKVGRDDSHIRFSIEDGKTVIDITSKFGIDKATIKRKSPHWPKSILIRLHLAGLESFRARAKDVSLEWFVSSTGEKSSTLHKAKQEILLDKKSPYYTEVRIAGANAKQRYFDVPLPAKLFEENPSEITLQWVDFFRN